MIANLIIQNILPLTELKQLNFKNWKDEDNPNGILKNWVTARLKTPG